MRSLGPIPFSYQVLCPFPLSKELSCATPLAAFPEQCSWVSKGSRQAKEALLFLQMKIGHILIIAAVKWWLHQVHYYSLYFSAYLKFSIIKAFLNYNKRCLSSRRCQGVSSSLGVGMSAWTATGEADPGVSVRVLPSARKKSSLNLCPLNQPVLSIFLKNMSRMPTTR